MSLSVSFDHLSKTILKGKSDAALLLGITWEELRDTDRVTRLVLLTDPPVPGMPVIQVFLHDLTRLTLKDHGRPVSHLRPCDVDIHRVRFELEGHTYAVAHRLDASWDYFRETHKV